MSPPAGDAGLLRQPGGKSTEQFTSNNPIRARSLADGICLCPVCRQQLLATGSTLSIHNGSNRVSHSSFDLSREKTKSLQEEEKQLWTAKPGKRKKALRALNAVLERVASDPELSADLNEFWHREVI
jgi:hypothetical protein